MSWRSVRIPTGLRIYKLIGYGLIVLYALGPWAGLLIGAVYFVTCWFLGGVYLSCVIHMGIQLRFLDGALGSR